jgi:hypothetical protein
VFQQNVPTRPSALMPSVSSTVASLRTRAHICPIVVVVSPAVTIVL